VVPSRCACCECNRRLFEAARNRCDDDHRRRTVERAG
jgi:hypothetical protein